MALPQPAVVRNSLPFQQNLPDRETLWQQSYLEAFHRNYDSVQRWTRWKDDHERVKGSLETLPDKLSHEVVIPFGSKALMKAKLVHTNEILTCIGSSYFVKQSAKQGIAMCERRIKQSEEMLTKLDNERTLLSNRQTIPKLEEAFPNDDTKEIIEEYNEEAETEWRRQHREREAEYRRKLSELRKSQVEQPPLQTEEDVFRRLDELELEEELNDELERLHAEYEADYENNDEDEGESSENEEADDSEEDKPLITSVKQSIVNHKSEPQFGRTDSMDSPDSEKKSVGLSGYKNYKAFGIPSSSLSPTCREAWSEETTVDFEALKKTRRISFADEASHSKVKNDVEEKANIHIRFSHSEQPSERSTSKTLEVTSLQDQVVKPKYLTPADIYNNYKAQCSPQPKSILKKSSSYPEKLQDSQTKQIQNSASFGSRLGITFADSEEEDGGLSNYEPARDLSHLPPVLGDVQESVASSSQSTSQETSQRPVSRFKQARQKKQ